MMEMRMTERNGSFGCPVHKREQAGAGACPGRRDEGERAFPEAAGAYTGFPRACFLGREAGGLIAALSPFFEREALTPRELRLLIDLILVKAGPAGAADASAITPELDLIGDTAELWLFDRRSDTDFRHSWRLEENAARAFLPLPANELERLLTLRAYLLSCPEDPAGKALLADIEKRITKVTSGRAARRSRVSGAC